LKFISGSQARGFALGLLSMATLPVWAANAVVPGSANLNLAGRAPDYACCFGDALPGQGPTLVSGLTLVAGQVLTFVVSGEVSYYGASASGNNPDGSFYGGTPADYGDGITAPSNVNRVDALMGLFLGPTSPTGSTSPAAIDFSGGLNFNSLSPLVGQMFFIGNGKTGDTNAGDFGGTVQQFVVPTGATRLYLGTSDGFGWYNNSGQFLVEIPSAVPEPGTYALMGLGLALVGLSARARRRSVA
jgi:hypothetical protein